MSGPEWLAEALGPAFDAFDSDVEPVLFVDDSASLRMASAWRKVKRNHAEPPGAPDVDPAALLRWAWGLTTYSIDDWAMLAGVPLTTARRLARVLIENRVVYPDGTVNSIVGRTILQRALSKAKR